MESHTYNEAKRRFDPTSTQCVFCTLNIGNAPKEDTCYYPVYRIQNRSNYVVY